MTNLLAGSPDYRSPEIDHPQALLAGSKLAEARQRLPLNILSNLTWLVLNMIVGLWYTPYLIAHLGVAVYGLVPLASSITQYLALLTDGFNSAVSRFLQIELAKDDSRAANRIYNTSIAGALTILIIILPITFLGSWLAPHIFHVPGGYGSDTQWLVLLTMLAFGVTFLSGSYAVSSFASHRFDLRLGVNTIRLAMQMGCVVLLFALFSPRLWQVGVGILLSAILALIGHSYLCRRLTPQLTIRPGLIDFSQLKLMLRFSGWVLVNQIGTQLFLNIDLIVANLVFGAQIAGRYGAVIIFPVLLRTLVGTISSVLDPIVFTLYAQNNPAGMVRFCRLSVKIMGLAVAMPVGIICGLARPLLTVWLGPEYSGLSWLVVALVGHLCINIAVVPLFSIQVATNQVRLPGILTLIMGMANAGLACAFALWSGWGYISIALAGAIVLTAKNALFTPLYAARILKLPWHTFFQSLIKGMVGFVAVALGTYWISSVWTLASWDSLAIIGIGVSSLFLVVAYFLGLSADDRLIIKTQYHRRNIGAIK